MSIARKIAAGLAALAVAGGAFLAGHRSADAAPPPTVAPVTASASPSATDPNIITATATATVTMTPDADPDEPGGEGEAEPEVPQLMWLSDAELGVTVLCAITSGGLSCDWANAEIAEGQP